MCSMPGKDGIDACREIMELLPDTRVMMLTASTEEDAVIESVAAGATGLPSEVFHDRRELVEAVPCRGPKGGIHVPDMAVRRVFGHDPRRA